jgi:hypothetical protein
MADDWTATSNDIATALDQITTTAAGTALVCAGHLGRPLGGAG